MDYSFFIFLVILKGNAREINTSSLNIGQVEDNFARFWCVIVLIAFLALLTLMSIQEKLAGLAADALINQGKGFVGRALLDLSMWICLDGFINAIYISAPSDFSLHIWWCTLGWLVNYRLFNAFPCINIQNFIRLALNKFVPTRVCLLIEFFMRWAAHKILAGVCNPV